MGKDTLEYCCRSELMHSENAPNYIFSMFEAFCEDIKLDKRNFDERYGKSFYEAIENFEASVSIGLHSSKKTIRNMLHVLFLEPTIS